LETLISIKLKTEYKKFAWKMFSRLPNPILESLQNANQYAQFHSPQSSENNNNINPVCEIVLDPNYQMDDNKENESLQNANQYAQFYSPQSSENNNNINPVCEIVLDNKENESLQNANQYAHSPQSYENNNNINPVCEIVLDPNYEMDDNKENWNGRVFLTENKRSKLMLPNFRKNQQNFRPSCGEEQRIKRVGEYEFTKDPRNIIGSGAFSVVYAGNHYHQKSMKVAIKVIDTIKCNNSHIDEIYTTKSISNPNVVHIYDYYLEPTKAKCYLVLELCNQGSLDRHKPHPGQNLSNSQHLKTLYGYFQQILKGLRPLYDLNIMHRDLKLSNVLLNDGVVKISDFGFAKQMGNFSQLNSVKCGTITTMAPEILFGEKSQVTFNKKSDIWSLGVMLHELVYGIHPFDMNLNDIANGKRVKIDNVYPLAEDFIRNALNYDLSERMSWEEVFIHPINFIDDDEVFFKKQIDTIRYHENGNINNMFEGKAGRKGRNFIRNSKGMHNQKKRNREEFEKNLVIVLLVVLFGLMLYLL